VPQELIIQWMLSRIHKMKLAIQDFCKGDVWDPALLHPDAWCFFAGFSG
jgi:hypothetical protein